MSGVDEREARLQLSCVVEPGAKALADLVEQHGVLRIWESVFKGEGETGMHRRARALDVELVHRLARAVQARFVVPGDDEWPATLDDLIGCEVQGMGGRPLGLWVRGPRQLAQVCEGSVAIVGSRAATQYGLEVSVDLAAELVSGPEPRAIVSGGAYGIDCEAHTGALAGQGRTVAVLARGCDEPYPLGNERLLRRLMTDELVVSEAGLGQLPTRQRFLSRNRLIAALAQGTVVVEAAVRSGARNTATWAAALGRVVMAVPGPVNSATSATTNAMIRDHSAELVAGADDVRSLLAPAGQHTLPLLELGPEREVDALEPDERAVFEAVPARGGRTSGEVSLAAGVPMMTCLAVLERLLDAGWVRLTDHGLWKVARVQP